MGDLPYNRIEIGQPLSITQELNTLDLFSQSNQREQDQQWEKTK